jgi:hypothetical protein
VEAPSGFLAGFSTAFRRFRHKVFVVYVIGSPGVKC